MTWLPKFRRLHADGVKKLRTRYGEQPWRHDRLDKVAWVEVARLRTYRGLHAGGVPSRNAEAEVKCAYLVRRRAMNEQSPRTK